MMQYYKLHQYGEAVSRYEDLAASADDEADSDLLTNYYASSISDNRAQDALLAYPQDAESVGDCFDLLFNVACAYISSGQIAQAEATLQSALELCRSVLSEDGLGDDEIAAESTAISLQKTFVDILMGRASQRSLDECREVLKNRKKSDELMAVAANNLAVLRGDKDLPDSLRRLRSTISSASEEKLTRSQLMDLRYNRCILLLHLKKVDECAKTLDDLDKM
jgi:signal recognition particle subunit SRP72